MRIQRSKIGRIAGMTIALCAAIGLVVSVCACSSAGAGSSGDGSGSATPVIQSESFDGITFVTLSCATAGATIHYTTDGSDPTASSKVYSDAFPLFATTTVKAVALKADVEKSDLATKIFTVENYTHKVVSNTPYFVKNNVSTALPVPSLTVSCSTNCCGVTASGDVYVAGSTTDATGKSKPCYWLNGVYHVLALPATAESGNTSYNIIVEDGDFYVHGYTTDAAKVTSPCYWKNGSYVALSVFSSSLGGTVGDSMTIGDDGSIYVSGTVRLSAGVDTPCYWKDGTYHTLSLPGALEGKSEQMVVSGSNVYVVGIYYDGTGSDVQNSKPCIWINGTYSALEAPTLILSSSMYSCGYRTSNLYISGTDVYVGGYTFCLTSGMSWMMSPAYWKNGKITTLPLPAYTNASGGVWCFKDMGGTVVPFGSWSNNSSYGLCYWSGGVCQYGMYTK